MSCELVTNDAGDVTGSSGSGSALSPDNTGYKVALKQGGKIKIKNGPFETTDYTGDDRRYLIVDHCAVFQTIYAEEKETICDVIEMVPISLLEYWKFHGTTEEILNKRGAHGDIRLE